MERLTIVPEQVSLEKNYCLSKKTFIFVGENRSKTAQEKEYSWEGCQRSGKPVLSAIRFFDALSYLGLDPGEQIILNLWNDDWTFNIDVLGNLKVLADKGEIIVGMGKRVQTELERLGIPHRKLIHPAARGKIASKELYRRHLGEVLSE